MSDDVTGKIIIAVMILTAAWLGGWVAKVVVGSAGATRASAAHANAAAGGFLLGAGLFHFLPEAHLHFEELYPGHEFPIGFTLCAIGFVGILALERLLYDPEAHHPKAEGAVTAAPVLAIALSLHAVLAGFAVGSKPAELTVFALAGALAVHKFAAAFTLGSILLRGGASTSTLVKVVGAFSVATPIGLALGTGFQHLLTDRTGLLVEASFDALAAGTFLYIAALDVIHETFFHKKASWWDLVLFVAGLAIMAALSLVA
ncbi:MAG: ZIP family metal transporter [Alphaproteobacteria bacterium]|nr:ZIP family metal transporter [Alphaproteobacteria bacterium]